MNFGVEIYFSVKEFYFTVLNSSSYFFFYVAINNLSFVIYIRASDKRTYNYLKAKLYSVDQDKVAHDKLSHLDLCCLQTCYLHFWHF